MQAKESWVEPQVVIHAPLVDVTGQKYKEKEKEPNGHPE